MKMRIFKCNTKNFKKAAASADRFSRDEDGGVFTIFVAVGFILIMATAGIGVDIMNFERDRASLQGTLDRAVLAAANVKQELPPVEVVKSYIEKSEVRGKLTGEPVVVDDPRGGSRKVTANAEVDVKTHFLTFFGYGTLTAAVTSVAEESIGSIEIAMVLDISGSMSWDSATENKTKMEALKDAATQFVTTMYQKENPDKISISIIPYNNQVNAGANILGNMPGVTTEHDYSHCVDFVDSDFREHWIDPDKSLNRTAHFDRRNYNDDYNDERHQISRSVCTTRAGSDITAVTNVVSELHDQIAAMTPGGNTSIDIGVKWGAALLDPQFQPVINKLSRQNADPDSVDPDTGLDVTTGLDPKKIVPAVFDNRPMKYESDVKKILIVMTDGENTENWVLNEAYRDGPSDVWYNPNYEHEVRSCWYNRWGQLRCRTDRYGGEYSVRISAPDEPPAYYWTRQELEGQTEPFGGEAADQSVRLTYPQLWNRVTLDWNAEYNYAWQSNHNQTWYDNAFTEIYRTKKDTRLSDICTQVKGKNVDVYGIAFEAPDVGVTAIRNCSSGAGFFYEVKASGGLGDDQRTITEVFDSIATAIKRLRLTQ
ncbi:Tad domain-containing protein [Ruegeria atlantica]|uniref:Tad domain-containing protein n=1 Tax=Ruegeria atlantica TaxID=81569 RepID=UPI0024949021|nr:Tad domain-containing protein [Ruegeria atlantica]